MVLNMTGDGKLASIEIIEVNNIACASSWTKAKPPAAENGGTQAKEEFERV